MRRSRAGRRGPAIACAPCVPAPSSTPRRTSAASAARTTARRASSAPRHPRSPLPGPELRQRDLVVDLFEDDLDRHADPKVLVRALHDVRVHTRTFLELDERDVVW